MNIPRQCTVLGRHLYHWYELFKLFHSLYWNSYLKFGLCFFCLSHCLCPFVSFSLPLPLVSFSYFFPLPPPSLSLFFALHPTSQFPDMVEYSGGKNCATHQQIPRNWNHHFRFAEIRLPYSYSNLNWEMNNPSDFRDYKIVQSFPTVMKTFGLYMKHSKSEAWNYDCFFLLLHIHCVECSFIVPLCLWLE